MSNFPARFEPLKFALLLSGVMPLLVSSVASWHSLGSHGDFGELWLASSLNSWLIAFPAVMVVAFMLRKWAAHWVRPHP